MLRHRRVVVGLIISLLISLGSFSAYGQEQPFSSARLQVTIPLIDIPFNRSDGSYVFSMQQSVALSKSYYQTTYPLLLQGLDINGSKPNLVLAKTILFTSYVLASEYLPLGDIWVHEEYHRAVLKNRGVDSYNNIYDVKFFGDSVSVSRVKDEDLIALKRNYPQDLIRSHAAGYEGDNQLISALEKDAFFLGTNPINFVVFLNVLQAHLYIRDSTSSILDTITDEINKEEVTMRERDFTGFDFAAWTYDLFRPDEDYTVRGVHPSGVGIDRYIKLSDLTQEEKRFLKKQRDLSLFNFVNRIFFKVKEPLKIKLRGEEFLFNVRPMHYLTSFGYTVNADFFIKKTDLNLFVSLKNQFNFDRYFPGLDVEVVRHPVQFLGKDLLITPRLSVWLQPEDQKFKTSHSEAGALISTKVDYPIGKGWITFVELEGKTKGWVAGNVYLDRNVSARTGVSILF